MPERHSEGGFAEPRPLLVRCREPQRVHFCEPCPLLVQVPEIGGFKTIDEGHMDIWPLIQRREAALRPFEYDDVPLAA
jgi:hypothetical protein